MAPNVSVVAKVVITPLVAMRDEVATSTTAARTMPAADQVRRLPAPEVFACCNQKVGPFVV